MRRGEERRGEERDEGVREERCGVKGGRVRG